MTHKIGDVIRLLESITFSASGCWLWAYPHKNQRYGRIYAGGKTVLAHRFSWEAYRSAIPDGMNVLHKCDVDLCVNPYHLFIGTQLDNMLDMVAKGRDMNQHKLKTHCKNGHEFSEQNTRLTSGGRECRICRNAYINEWQKAKRAANRGVECLQ